MPDYRSRLLIVDDNKVNRLLLSRHIDLLGHRFELAENGRVALEKLRSEPFDLLAERRLSRRCLKLGCGGRVILVTERAQDYTGDARSFGHQWLANRRTTLHRRSNDEQ